MHEGGRLGSWEYFASGAANTLYCDPYFVVWKAFKALNVPNGCAPAHHHRQEVLIRKIGKIMWARGLAPKA